jgi:hypothetical protein
LRSVSKQPRNPHTYTLEYIHTTPTPGHNVRPGKTCCAAKSRYFQRGCEDLQSADFWNYLEHRKIAWKVLNTSISHFRLIPLAGLLPPLSCAHPEWWPKMCVAKITFPLNSNVDIA